MGGHHRDRPAAVSSSLRWHADTLHRRRHVVIAGHQGDAQTAREALKDHEGVVRASALGALQRCGELDAVTLTHAFTDPDPEVRRRAAELAAHHTDTDLMPALHDAEALVVEMAAWSCGEHEQVNDAVLEQLIHLAGTHDEPLVREAAVAALGAIGDVRGVPAILAGCRDKPAIRRRAVLALAPFDGPDVEAALERALTDRDWQVRQAAEDLTSPDR
jgi:HEAT repeat protein